MKNKLTPLLLVLAFALASCGEEPVTAGLNDKVAVTESALTAIPPLMPTSLCTHWIRLPWWGNVCTEYNKRTFPFPYGHACQSFTFPGSSNLWSGPNFTGQCIEWPTRHVSDYIDDMNLSKYGYFNSLPAPFIQGQANFHVGSMVVFQSTEAHLCDEIALGGTCTTYNEGSYPNMPNLPVSIENRTCLSFTCAQLLPPPP